MGRKLCPCCKQKLSDETLVGLSVNTLRARLYVAVKKAGNTGIDSKKLFDEVYGIAAGPLTGLRNLHVMIWRMNKTLAAYKKVIRNKGAKKGGNKALAVYYLTRIRS
jgi:predicted membrane protein